MDLALNNLQWLICHKTKQNQTKRIFKQIDLCHILTLDRAINQRCTCVNKQKKKRKQMGVMKEYRQVLGAVELAGDRNVRVRTSLQTEGCGPQRPPVEQPQPRCRRSAAMVKRRTWVNIAVCPCLQSSVTHHKNIENKVWEIYFCKELCSFIHWSCHYVWLCSRLYIYIYCICIHVVHNIWAKDSKPTGKITPGQSRPESNGNEGLTPYPLDLQNWNIATWHRSYPGHLFRGVMSYLSTKNEVSVFKTILNRAVTVL